MRVTYVINSLGAGGAEQSILELVPPLRESGVELSLVTLSPPAAGVLPESGRSVEVVHLGGRGLLDKARRLRRLLRETGPDLVHTSLFDADVAGRLAGRAAGVPVMTSLVNTMYDPARLSDPAVDARKLRVVKAVDSLTARHLTTHFHAITHAVKASCVETMGLDPARVTVVERGRDRSRLGRPGPERRAATRRALGIADDARLVLTVGRQEWQKGQAALIDAFDLVAERVPDAVLVLAGRPGHASGEVEAARARSGAADRVHVLGHRDDVGDLLAAADVFAFPSHYEGLGGSVIEAMAMALPVVVTRIPALEEVVEEGANALVVDRGDTTALAGSLEAVLTDDALRRRMSARSQEVYEERFTLERSSGGMAALYDAVGRGGR